MSRSNLHSVIGLCTNSITYPHLRGTLQGKAPKKDTALREDLEVWLHSVSVSLQGWLSVAFRAAAEEEKQLPFFSIVSHEWLKASLPQFKVWPGDVIQSSLRICIDFIQIQLRPVLFSWKLIILQNHEIEVMKSVNLIGKVQYITTNILSSSESGSRWYTILNHDVWIQMVYNIKLVISL